jgi:hypothetical protein
VYDFSSWTLPKKKKATNVKLASKPTIPKRMISQIHHLDDQNNISSSKTARDESSLAHVLKYWLPADLFLLQ